MCVYKRIKQVSVLKGVKLTVNCLNRYELYRLSLELDGKKTNFYGPIFLLPVEDKIGFKTQKSVQNRQNRRFLQPGSTVAPVMFGFIRWVKIKCRLTGCMTSNLVGHI